MRDGLVTLTDFVTAYSHTLPPTIVIHYFVAYGAFMSFMLLFVQAVRVRLSLTAVKSARTMDLFSDADECHGWCSDI